MDIIIKANNIKERIEENRKCTSIVDYESDGCAKGCGSYCNCNCNNDH